MTEQTLDEPTAPATKKEVDDVTVMSRIKLLMAQLPKDHQVRVAKWTAERWG